MYCSTAANAARSLRNEQESSLKRIGVPAVPPNFQGINLFDIERAYLILAAVFGFIISPKKTSLLRIIFQKLVLLI